MVVVGQKMRSESGVLFLETFDRCSCFLSKEIVMMHLKSPVMMHSPPKKS